jgi:hypothetical protein
MTFRPSLTRTTKKSSSFLYSAYNGLCFALNGSRFGSLPCFAYGPLTGIYQASTFIAKSDASLCDSDHFALASDALPEHDGSDTFEGLDGLPLDADEAAFVDLFTESESSQDTENMVCGCPIAAPHLTRNLGCVACNFHIYGSSAAPDARLHSSELLVQKKQLMFALFSKGMSLLLQDWTMTGNQLTRDEAPS